MHQHLSDQQLVTPPPKIVLNGLTVRFANKILFDKLSTEFPKGKCSCILGSSGSGKSTLLKSIAGLVGDNDKVVMGDGFPLDGKVAWMDQRDLLLPWLNAMDNVQLGMKLRGEQRKDQQALKLLEGVGLKGQESLMPHMMSGGMRQRVALARTLMENKPLVLMDEPFSSVDAITRIRLQSLASKLLLDRTVLLVTHDPWEALRLGHCIYILGGSPAQLGNPIEPPGNPPREPTNPEMSALAKALLCEIDAN